MNVYKINYTSNALDEDGNIQTGYSYITERTEAAAKKQFTKINGADLTLTGIELTRTNATATKDQEREALAKIRAMVEELGPDSYIATAFSGCFDLAEENIEYDFGDSWKERALRFEQNAKEADDRAKQSELKLANLEARFDKQLEAMDRLTQQHLNLDNLRSCYDLVNSQMTELNAKLEKAAAAIVEYAEAPTSTEFQQAVADHRRFTSEIANVKNLLDNIDGAMSVAA